MSLASIAERIRRAVRGTLPKPIYQRGAAFLDGLKSVQKFGVRGYRKLSTLSGSPPSTIPSEVRLRLLAHPIYVRPGTPDAHVVVQSFAREAYSFRLPDKPVRLIIDGGANIGDTALWYSTHFPEALVVAIEPDSDNFALLTRNCDPYGRRIHAIQAALWPVSHRSLALAGAFTGAQVSESGEADGPTCPSIDPMTLLDDCGCDSIDIFKIDIEGAEQALFSGPSDDWLRKTRSMVVAATMRYRADVSVVGVLTTVARSLGMSMLASGIEVFGKHSRSFGIRLIFVCSFILNLGFGLISGMKFEVLMPLFTLTILLGITQKRLPRFVWALPLVYLALQPFVIAYRVNLNAGYDAQIGTIDGLTSTLAKSGEDALSSGLSLSAGHRSAFETAEARLSVLTLFHNVLQLPSPDLLNGDETVWMAPFYPFIPRPLWKGKPIFNKGQRMSEALGIGRVSSTNVPGIADLYALGGVGGIVSGMFIWGACLQFFMNSVRGGVSERGTFLYVLILFSLANIERDIVATIGGAVETACILLIFSKFIYGGPLISMRSGFHQAPVSRA